MSATMTPLQRAVEYGRAGIKVFPVHWNPGGDDHKAPMRGYAWRISATSNPDEIQQDFVLAEMDWGIDGVAIAWATGEDGYVVIDIDRKEIPAWTQAFDFAAAINETGKGWHLICKFPTEFEPGNGTTNLPDRNHVDVRGKGGYIMIDAPDRPGLAIEELAKCQPFPRADWLVPYGGQIDALDMTELQAFRDRYSQSKMPNAINGIKTRLDHFDARRAEGIIESRHNKAIDVMVLAGEDAIRGLYPFGDAIKLVSAWWKLTTADEPSRHGREWRNIVCWAAGRAQLNVNPPADDGSGSESPNPQDDGITPYVDWARFWTDDVGEHEWLIEGFWPAGRAVLLHAPAKTGKSEYALYCAVELALGVRLDSGEQFRTPTAEQFPVMYVDYEMTEADLRERLMEFGVGPQHDLSNLHYTLLTSDFTGLDTPGGAALFLAEVDRLCPRVVILDTFGRAVDGDENDADTVRHFYSLTGRGLKQRGISYLRVDHTGKDHSKGARGSSAKNDDVDLVWSMQRTVEGFQAKSRSRVSWVPQTLNVARINDPERLYYTLAADISELVVDENVTAKVYELVEAGIDPTWGRDRVVKALQEMNIPPGRLSILSAAIKYRRDAAARGAVIHRP